MQPKHQLTNICIFFTDPQLLFMSAWSQLWSHFFKLSLPKNIFCISPWLITFHYRKSMLPLQYLSDWYLHGVYVWQKFQRKNLSNWVIIWMKFKVLWLLLRATQCFGFFLTPAAKANKSWLGTLGPDCYLIPKIGHLQKTEVAFKS